MKDRELPAGRHRRAITSGKNRSRWLTVRARPSDLVGPDVPRFAGEQDENPWATTAAEWARRRARRVRIAWLLVVLAIILAILGALGTGGSDRGATRVPPSPEAPAGASTGTEPSGPYEALDAPVGCATFDAPVLGSVRKVGACHVEIVATFVSTSDAASLRGVNAIGVRDYGNGRIGIVLPAEGVWIEREGGFTHARWHVVGDGTTLGTFRGQLEGVRLKLG